MKRIYVSPECNVADFELTTFILANSIPQSSSAARRTNDKERDIDSWGNIWK